MGTPIISNTWISKIKYNFFALQSTFSLLSVNSFRVQMRWKSARTVLFILLSPQRAPRMRVWVYDIRAKQDEMLQFAHRCCVRCGWVSEASLPPPASQRPFAVMWKFGLFYSERSSLCICMYCIVSAPISRNAGRSGFRAYFHGIFQCNRNHSPNFIR